MITIKKSIALVVASLTPLYSDKQVAFNVAWILLENLTGQRRSLLCINQDRLLVQKEYDQLLVWVQELVVDMKPLQYILGTVHFLDATIFVEPPILIPRPETEEWVARFITTIKERGIEQFSLLDLCTGSGCIAIACAQAFSKSVVTATDISDQACALAYKNIAHNNVTNVTVIKTDLFDGLLHDQYDVILANPPYIAVHELHVMDVMVTKWEDHRALFADDDGLCLIKKIIYHAYRYLKTDSLITPQVWIEIGYKQGPAVQTLLEDAGFKASIYQDSSGNDRVAVGQLIFSKQ